LSHNRGVLSVLRRPAPSPRTLHLLGFALAATIFVADAALPSSSVVGMLYVGVVLLGLWTPWVAYPAIAAVAVSMLSIVDLVIAWPEPMPWLALMNRLLMIAVFAITAFVVRRFANLEGQLLVQLDQLADFKRALDAAAIVAITDVQGRITYVNDKFVEISGYPREELLGQDHRIINSGHHPPEFIRTLWRTIVRGEVWNGELCNRARDGHLYWVDTTIVPFVSEAGKPYQYIAIRADITGRKQAEAAITQQAALARVGQMAAVLAHEIRNPLAGIRGAMEILIRRPTVDDADRAVMQEIITRTGSLNELIGDLLLFARPRPPRLAEVDVRPLVADVIGALQQDPLWQQVDFDVRGPDLRVQADYELTRATVFNLVLNAAQAVQGRGRIVVTTSAGEHGTVHLQVQDDGPGIPADIREQIFEPFFTTKARGGGLGLPIALRTAELHGGALTVLCPPDGGTLFTLTLPAAP
jgi:PAS domain S-box-containing protein